jgi:hypothetical protein
VDQAAADMQTETQKPQNQKNDKDRPKHVNPPFVHVNVNLIKPYRYCGGFSSCFGFSFCCFFSAGFSAGARAAGCVRCCCCGAGRVSAGGEVRWGCERSLGGGVCGR